MKLTTSLTAGECFKRALLICASWPDEGEWKSLVNLTNAASSLSDSRYGKAELRYSTLKRLRSELIYQGYLAQRRSGRHYQLKLTDAGKERLSQIEAEDSVSSSFTVEQNAGAGSLSALEPPYRVGRDHMLPKEMYRSLMDQVAAGDLDLMIVPRNMRASKYPYWDQAVKP